MLTMTKSARSRIQDAAREADLPLRLEPRDDGSFLLTPDDWRSGDMSYAFDGSALVVVRGDLARRLADWKLELDSRAGKLRARHQGDVRQGPDAQEPEASRTRSVQLTLGSGS